MPQASKTRILRPDLSGRRADCFEALPLAMTNEAPQSLRVIHALVADNNDHLAMANEALSHCEGVEPPKQSALTTGVSLHLSVGGLLRPDEIGARSDRGLSLRGTNLLD